MDEMSSDVIELTDELVEHEEEKTRLKRGFDFMRMHEDQITRPSLPGPQFEEPEGTTFEAGESFMGYRILDVLGVGGMAVVYRARRNYPSETGQAQPVVALKITPTDTDDPEEVFIKAMREANLGRRVRSPYIARTYESGFTEDGQCYIVSELVHGFPLDHVLEKRGKLRDPFVISFAIDVLRGLEVIHGAGWAHADVKPENIIVPGQLSGGAVDLTHSIENAFHKLIDFGISVPLGSTPSTSTALVGTPEFLAPEILSGGAITEPSDLYSLGVVMYRSLKGALPFEGETAWDVMDRQLNSRPEPLPEEVGPGLATYVMKLLSKRPEERFRSAGEALELLERSVERVTHRQSGSFPRALTRPKAGILKRRSGD